MGPLNENMAIQPYSICPLLSLIALSTYVHQQMGTRPLPGYQTLWYAHILSIVLLRAVNCTQFYITYITMKWLRKNKDYYYYYVPICPMSPD
jgi:hypothetical protein